MAKKEKEPEFRKSHREKKNGAAHGFWLQRKQKRNQKRKQIWAGRWIEVLVEAP